MTARPAVALLAALLLAPPAVASRGDIYFETVHYTNNNLDGVHLLRIAGSGAPTTVASSTSLPSFGQALFARGDGTVLISDGSGSAAVSPGGSFHKLSFRGPGIRRGDVPIALGFLRSGGAAYSVRSTGIFASGRGLGGRLRLMRGSRRALSPKGKLAGVVRQLVASDGSIISEVHYGTGRIRSVRFERYDPRSGRTTTIVQGGPIRSAGVNMVWTTLPGGGLVVVGGNPPNTTFYLARPRRGLWRVSQFAPVWHRPIDDGGIAIAGLSSDAIAIVHQPTVDRGRPVLDEGIQVLRLSRGGTPQTLYDVAPNADGDRALGVIAVEP